MRPPRWTAPVFVACRVVWRLRAELAHHAHLRRAALRAKGLGAWQAWLEARMPLPEVIRVYRDTLTAWREPDGPRQPSNAPPGLLRRWLPFGFAALAAILALAGPGHPWVADSMLGRLPRPAWRNLTVISLRRPTTLAALAVSGRGDGEALAYTQPCLPTFRLTAINGRGGELTALQGTPQFFALLGAPAPGGGAAWITPTLARRLPRGIRTVRVGATTLRIAGVLPREEAFLFRPAAVWMQLPAVPDLAVYQLSGLKAFPTSARPVATFWNRPQMTPLAAFALDDLSYARFGFACLLLLLLGGAAADLRRSPHKLATARYWGYLAANAVSVGLLLYAACGCLVELWPRLGVIFAVLSLDLWLFVVLGAWRWWRNDRRYRCRTCLRRLSWPQEHGRWGGVLLTAPACEYLCAHGHGRLRMPAQSGQLYPLESWEYAGDWWQELVSAHNVA